MYEENQIREKVLALLVEILGHDKFMSDKIGDAGMSSLQRILLVSKINQELSINFGGTEEELESTFNINQLVLAVSKRINGK